MPSIRAHAQKFLGKLVKFVSENKPLDNLSEEDIQYYYGLLNTRIHKSTKTMLMREKASKEREALLTQLKHTVQTE